MQVRKEEQNEVKQNNVTLRRRNILLGFFVIFQLLIVSSWIMNLFWLEVTYILYSNQPTNQQNLIFTVCESG